MARVKVEYVCSSCGTTSPKWVGKCPGCGEWNTVVEEIQAPVSAKRAGVACHSQEPLTLEQMHAVTSGEIVETQALLASARQLGDVKLIGQLQRILAQQTNAALRIAAKARPDPDVIVLSRAEIEEARKTVVETLVRYVETAIREVNHPE